jgi:predicted PurR-regulated permease PerM
MMIGTIRINLIVALLAGIFTFALSIGNNLFLSSCIKAGYSSLILFVVTFGFRWVLGLLIGPVSSLENSLLENSSSVVGQNLDLSTPDEDEETRQLMKSNHTNQTKDAQSNDMQFSPLNPPKLVTKNNLDPEQLAGALRRMSED